MSLKKIAAGLLGGAALASAGPLKIGADLPDLRGKNQRGEEVVLKAKEGDTFLFIFTYPKAATPG